METSYDDLRRKVGNWLWRSLTPKANVTRTPGAMLFTVKYSLPERCPKWMPEKLHQHLLGRVAGIGRRNRNRSLVWRMMYATAVEWIGRNRGQQQSLFA